MAINHTPAIRTIENAEKSITEILFDEPTQPMSVFDVLGVSKPALLVALYNAAKIVDSHYSSDMTLTTATRIVNGFSSCGYWNDGLSDFTAAGRGESKGCAGYGSVDQDGVFMGRVLDIDLTPDEMDTSGYDRVNGEGAAFRATKTVLAALERGLMTPVLDAGDDW